jgi:hypothetical protein
MSVAASTASCCAAGTKRSQASRHTANARPTAGPASDWRHSKETMLPGDCASPSVYFCMQATMSLIDQIRSLPTPSCFSVCKSQSDSSSGCCPGASGNHALSRNFQKFPNSNFSVWTTIRACTYNNLQTRREAGKVEGNCSINQRSSLLA